MDTTAYIESGILHEYCLGTLSAGERLAVEQVCNQYPEVAAELQQLQFVIGAYTSLITPPPDPAMQDSIWDVLDNINKEKAADPNAIPLINRYSDHNDWKRMVAPLMPQEITPGVHHIKLQHTKEVRQDVVISSYDIPPEMHTDELESFLILEGECTCYIGGTTLHLGPGDFVDVPLHVTHDVKIRSPYVVAILQHVAV